MPKNETIARLDAVMQAHANFAMENFTPDAQDKKLHLGYVLGAVTIDDMLAHARDFAQQFKNKVNHVTASEKALVCGRVPV